MSNLEHLGIDSEGELIKKEGKGCFFYGCLISVILLVVGAVAVGGGSYWLYNTVVDGILPYTEDKPLELEKVQYSPEEYGSVKKRIQTFSDVVKAGKGGRLELSSSDINMLITGEQDLQELEKYIRVRIVDGQLQGSVSLPLGKIPLGNFKGRYLNGWASFSINKEKGKEPEVFISDFKAGSKQLDNEAFEQLKKINLTKRAEGHDIKEKLKGVRKVDRIYVQGDKLVIEKDD